MPITTDYSVFLKGCIKNNAVDYKILYKNKCKENEELIIQADAETTADMINKLNEEYDKLYEDKLIVENENKLLQSKISKMEKDLTAKQMIYCLINDYYCENNLTNSDFMIWFGKLPYSIRYDQHAIDCMEELGFEPVHTDMIDYCCDYCWADNWEEFMSSEGYEEGDDEYEKARNDDSWDDPCEGGFWRNQWFPCYCFDNNLINNLIDYEEYYLMNSLVHSYDNEYSAYGNEYWIFNSP